MARLPREELPDMGDEGVQVTRRRERLQMDGISLAAEAGIHRNTLSAIENGKSGQRAKLVKVLQALDRLEAEAGLPPIEEEAQPRAAGEPKYTMVHLKNEFGEVFVEGPVENLEALGAEAQRLLREMRPPAG